MTRDTYGDKRGRNEPCWCGSGRKFKLCHLNRAHEARPSTAEVVKKLHQTSDQKNCSCPASYKHECNGKIIRAHSLSKRQALGAITEQGHVFSMMPDWSRLFHNDDARGRLIGINQASTFTGFCGKHDQEIFRALDTEEFDGNAAKTFLSAYRTLCRELFAKIGQLRSFEMSREMDRGRPDADQLFIQATMSAATEGANAALQELEALKARFDDALIRSDFRSFSFVNFRFVTPPDIVTAGGFNPTHDLNANLIQDLSRLDSESENLFFAILPTSTGFWASFLWPAEYPLMRKFTDHFERRATAGTSFAVAMAFVENSFLKPSMWTGLTSGEKKAVTSLAFMGVLDDDYSKLPSGLNFFERKYPAKPVEVVRSK